MAVSLGRAHRHGAAAVGLAAPARRGATARGL